MLQKNGGHGYIGSRNYCERGVWRCGRPFKEGVAQSGQKSGQGGGGQKRRKIEGRPLYKPTKAQFKMRHWN